MYEIDKKKFGAFVATLRKERGYTQRELAERLFLSDKAVSKWETGASIPDTSMLVPLAELLEVSVTELLLCQRVREEEPMDTEQVEDVVKAAVRYGERQPVRAYREKGRWNLFFLLSVLIGGIGTLYCVRHRIGIEILPTIELLGLIFGAYFCFFVPVRLPDYYDEHRITGVQDGIFRMNIPGLAFNNSNWPHIVKTCLVWCCLTLVLSPVVVVVLRENSWYVLLAAVLAGLFVPVYMVGKKFE